MSIAFPTYTAADVDLFGSPFVTVAATKTVRQQADGLDAELEQVGEDDEKAIDVFGRILDVRLKPKGNGRKKPSQLLREKWDADQVTVEQIVSFLEALGDTDRPT